MPTFCEKFLELTIEDGSYVGDALIEAAAHVVDV